MAAPAVSKETQEEAMKIASSTKKPGQTKEQTRLVAQGIEKGIALYKKQQKAKARERDKERKKQARLKISENTGQTCPNLVRIFAYLNGIVVSTISFCCVFQGFFLNSKR